PAVFERVAMRYLNAPYLWGGRSPFGIDCSGFTQVVFKFADVQLMRDAYQQAEQGAMVNFVEESQPGDLAFFSNDNGKIIHVGIVLKDQRIIHSSGKVRIDRLDHFGIYNADTKKYSHQLKVIKRFF
ncbi:MAG TPA: C40 family peptidase, partial [Chitinophagales bacterium]|nr:C40 family peptidase [Chitinophagales bacterium]